MMIEQFLDYLQFERLRSHLTVENYKKDLLAFQQYFKTLDSHLTWESVDTDIVRGWMEHMMDKGNCATSINRRLSALRSLFRFALARQLVATDPTRTVVGPKKKKALPQFLKESEVENLLNKDMWGDSFEDVRNRTILDVFYETGIRLSELLGLNDGDVDTINHQIKVTGKRNKQRLIPYGQALADALLVYLQKRNELSMVRGEDALFTTEKGERMTAYQVRKIVQLNLSKVSTLTKRSPHVLRHTFATAMLNHKAGLESVKKLLGHESLSTTEIYTHTTFEQLKQEYSEAHPRA